MQRDRARVARGIGVLQLMRAEQDEQRRKAARGPDTTSADIQTELARSTDRHVRSRVERCSTTFPAALRRGEYG
jgi:hypothetical protein